MNNDLLRGLNLSSIACVPMHTFLSLLLRTTLRAR